MTSDGTTRVRVRFEEGIHARGAGPSFAVGDALGLGADQSLPSSLDLTLGALGGELLTLLDSLCRREGLALDSLELSLTAEILCPLVALGVEGESGEPRIAAIRGTCHAVGLEADTVERLPALWQRAQERSVLRATLARACSLELRLNVI